MPEPMSALLKKIPTGTKITPKEFAGTLKDSDFDGSGTGAEMGAFFERAYECMKGSDKGKDRIEAMREAAPLLGLSSSRCFPKLIPAL